MKQSEILKAQLRDLVAEKIRLEAQVREKRTEIENLEIRLNELRGWLGGGSISYTRKIDEAIREENDETLPKVRVKSEWSKDWPVDPNYVVRRVTAKQIRLASPGAMSESIFSKDGKSSFQEIHPDDLLQILGGYLTEQRPRR